MSLRSLRIRPITTLAAVVILGAACGGSSEAGSGGNVSVAIEEPPDGARVVVPFKIELSAAVPLGPPESGNNHVHVFYDGAEDDYEVVNGTSYTVTDLAAGEHTIDASLRNADHSEAGAEDTVTVTVSGGGDDPGEGSEDDDEDDGYGY
ncbi:MAG: hypothetical protein ABR529_09615 [Actinomycetota bacterium]